MPVVPRPLLIISNYNDVRPRRTPDKTSGPCPLLLLLLQLSAAQTQLFESPGDFLAARCSEASDAEVFSCSLPPGNWSIQTAATAAHITWPMTMLSSVSPAPDANSSSTLNLPPYASGPLFNLASNSTLDLRGLRLTGNLLPNIDTRYPAAFLALRAFALSPGARLRLTNITIVTSNCTALALHQTFACYNSPSPNFAVGYGSLFVLSYSTASLDATDVTFTCSGRQLPPPCVADVVSTGRQLRESIGGTMRPQLNFNVPILIFIAHSLSLVSDDSPQGPALDDSPVAPSSRPPPLPPIPPQPPFPAITLVQAKLVIAGAYGSATVLNLGSVSTSMIRLSEGTRVQLQDITLTGLPPGPANDYPFGLLRAPVWTFEVARRLYGNSVQNRLVMLRVRLELTPVEAAMWAYDSLAPEMPAPPPPPLLTVQPVALCAVSNGFFSAGAANATLVELPAAGLLATSLMQGRASSTSTSTSASPVISIDVGAVHVPQAKQPQNALFIYTCQANGKQMLFQEVLFAPTLTDGEPGAADWRRDPLCQLLPQQPITVPPRVVELYTVSKVGMEILANRITPGMGAKEHGRMILSEDARLEYGPATMLDPSFMQTQAYMPVAAVLLGDPVRPRILDLRWLPAAINLRLPAASLTLRSMVLVNLAPAGIHVPSPPTLATEGKSAALVTGSMAAEGVSAKAAVRSEQPALETAEKGGPASSGRRGGRRRQREDSALAVGEDGGGRGAAGGGGSLEVRRRTQATEEEQGTRIMTLVRPPVGRDPTSGLPPGLTNFTSCLWALEFERGANSSSSSISRNSSSSSSSSSGTARAFLDSVVLLVPPAEVALLAWLWAWNDTAAVTDPLVAQQLRRWMDTSKLATGSDGPDSLVFEIFSWCGLEGSNVTVTAMQPITSPTVLAPLELSLPVAYPDGLSRAPGQSSGGRTGSPPLEPTAVGCNGRGCPSPSEQESSPPLVGPASHNSTAEAHGGGGGGGDHSALQDTNSGGGRGWAVAVACGVAGGVVAAICVCCVAAAIYLRVLRTRRRQNAVLSAAAAGADADADAPEQSPKLSSRACAATLFVEPLQPQDPPAAGIERGSLHESASTPSTGSASALLSACLPAVVTTPCPPAAAAAREATDGTAAASTAIAAMTSETADVTGPLALASAASGSAARLPPPPSKSAPSLDNQQLQEQLMQIGLALHSRFFQMRDDVVAVGSHSSAMSGSDARPTSTSVAVAGTTLPPSIDGIGTAAAAASALGTGVQAQGGGGGVAAAGGELVVSGELGRGAQGVVYRGRWKGLNVAVKVLLLHRMAPPPGPGGPGPRVGPSALEVAHKRALREAAISLAASQHPNVVATYHVDACGAGAQSSDECWKITLISQLCDGGSLLHALDSGLLAGCTADTSTVDRNTSAAGDGSDGARGAAPERSTTAPEPPPPPPPPQQQPLQPRVLLLLALDVASGLAQLHSTTIIHGDISSSNVLLSSVPRGSTSTSTATAGSTNTGTDNTDNSREGLGISAGTLTEDAWYSRSSDLLAALGDLSSDHLRRVRPAACGIHLRSTSSMAPLGWYGYVAKLCDFGLAEVLPAGQPHVRSQSRRSSAYTAPEIARDGLVGPAGDVYAWGVLCWEMALGTSLPTALAAQHGAGLRAWLAAADTDAAEQQPEAEADVGALPPGLLTWPPHVPRALVVLVGECLRPEAAARPSSRDLVHRLEHIITSL